ncbi:MAG: hypothetical protein MUF37_02050, partial [Methanoregulaceae archaeon]|nr:hypothetical protein [Methanoregulaceae archaeon]
MLVLVILLVAGCMEFPVSGTSEGSSIMYSTQVTTAPVTPVPAISELSEIAITRGEVPFPVVSQQSETQQPDNMNTGTFSGALRGFSQAYSSEAKDSPTATVLMQSIGEYPSGNAATSFAGIEKQFRELRDPATSIVWLQDPKVGDQSFALTSVQRTSSNPNPSMMIVFRKANIIEIIMLKTSNADVGALARVANTAAAKIPSSGTKTPVAAVSTTSISSSAAITSVPGVLVVTADSALAFTGPVAVTPLSKNSVGKITFDLQLNQGNSPVDMNLVQYTVSTPNSLWDTRGGSPAVRLHWVTTQGFADTLLETGEIVTVELNTGSLDSTEKTPGSGRRM